MAVAGGRRASVRAATTRGAETDAIRLGLALLPVRLFLGVTFVYAGVQKLSDPGFFHAGAPTYIGTQLRGFANGTPGGFLLRAFAIPHPTLAGVGVALAEIAIGLLVAAGVAVRPAAAVGLALNALLFFTNSWHTYPYFLGPDIVFVFAWLPFVLAGASRQPSLYPALHRLAAAGAARRRTVRAGAGAPPAPGHADRSSSAEPELTRRALLRAGVALFGAATAALAGFSLLLRGSYRRPRTLASATPRGGAQAAASAQPVAGSQAPPASVPPGAVKLGPASRLAAGEGATYSDPGNGSPDIVIRQRGGQLVAYSAVCTHAGCTVAYEGEQIVCPCHGAVYDPQSGAVISGPAPAPLGPRKVIESGGEIYALPS
jgi:thiosulfate dehydrogenase (quinone) large subunit